MSKNKDIGFKACVENDSEHTDSESISPNEIASATEEKIRAQQEFDNHMEEYENLKIQNEKYKYWSKKAILLVLLLALSYACYCLGAYRQILGVGPYKTVTTTDNQTIVVRK